MLLSYLLQIFFVEINSMHVHYFCTALSKVDNTRHTSVHNQTTVFKIFMSCNTFMVVICDEQLIITVYITLRYFFTLYVLSCVAVSNESKVAIFVLCFFMYLYI